MACRVRGDLRQATVDASGAALLAARLCTNTVTTSLARDRACTTHKQAAPSGGAPSSPLASGDELATAATKFVSAARGASRRRQRRCTADYKHAQTADVRRSSHAHRVATWRFLLHIFAAHYAFPNTMSCRSRTSVQPLRDLYVLTTHV